MSTFAQMSLPPSIVQRLLQGGITIPTPIQQAAIPPALEGRDLMAQAKTGSGKTLAFLLPMINRALRSTRPLSASGPEFLILAPTRELALQIDVELRKYAPPTMTSLPLYGGTPIERHYRALRHSPNVVVGTPGRLLDLAGTGKKHREFLATQTRHRLLAERLAKNVRDRHQDLVTGPVAMRVVDRLEPVEVEQHERIMPDNGAHAFLEGTAIEQPRQRICPAQDFEGRARNRKIVDRRTEDQEGEKADRPRRLPPGRRMRAHPGPADRRCSTKPGV